MLEVSSCNKNKLSDIQPIQGWNINPVITRDRMERLMDSTEIVNLIEKMQNCLQHSNQPPLPVHSDFQHQGQSLQG
jgi:hypothetical protein